MFLDFIAIDFETADVRNSAPCSLGITLVRDGAIVSTENHLINPQCEFSAYSTRVHGISADDVSDAPTFPTVWHAVSHLFDTLPIVAHNAAFDISVLEKACDRYDIPFSRPVLLDTYSLSVELLPDAESYRLSALCDLFNIDLVRAHDSGYDSAAAAQLFLSLQELYPAKIHPFSMSSIPHVSYPHAKTSEPACYRDSDVEFDCAEIVVRGKTFVLTGDVDGFSRDDLKTAICNAGGKVSPSVSKKVDYLVVGQQNVSVVKDKQHAKSTKILRAEQLRAEGDDICIVSAESLLCALEDARLPDSDLMSHITSESISELIKSWISPKYLCYLDAELRKGSSFDLLIFKYPSSVYHESGSLTIAHLKLTGSQYFVAFPPRAESVFRELSIPFYAAPDSWPRVSPLDLVNYGDVLKDQFDRILLGAFSFAKFGCCAKFVDCSNAGECLHADPLYAASACEYFRHLNAGRIFYGDRKNI